MNIVENLNNALAELLESHDLSVAFYNRWVIANSRFPSFSASVFRERQHEQLGYSLQVDIRVVLDSEAIIVESFVGFGKNRDEAVANALINFALNSLHPMLAAFLGRATNKAN